MFCQAKIQGSLWSSCISWHDSSALCLPGILHNFSPFITYYINIRRLLKMIFQLPTNPVTLHLNIYFPFSKVKNMFKKSKAFDTFWQH